MGREMKDSGVTWIGSIPKDWIITRNKNCFTCNKVIVGSDSSKTQLLSLTTRGVVQKDYYAVGGKLPESFDTYQMVDKDDLVMCLFDLDCSAVFSGLSHAKGMISPAYKVMKCRKGISPDYMDYWFRFIFDKRKYIPYAKNLRYTLSYDEFGGLPIISLPLDEQRRIADFLDDKCTKIDSTIEKTQKTIEGYKALKQSIITEAVTKGIRGNRPMKDSGIEWVGDIPEEWNSINPKALFSQRKEKAARGERQLTASQQYGVIYQDEFMELTGNKVVTVEKDFDILKHVEAGDFVISMRSFQGGLEYSTLTGSISSAYVMLIPNLELVFPRYYRWLLKSPVYINALQSTTNMVRDGQAMRYANFIKVRLFSVPLDEQEEIADYLDERCETIDKLIAEKEHFLVEMGRYKKSLIYEYVTGKKEVH